MMLRAIAGQSLRAIGLGCMNLSYGYGVPPDEKVATKLLDRALELGVRHFDSAALYGFGRNETLLGKVLKNRRSHIFLASKCGMTGVDGKRVIDGRPETLAATLEEALLRLQTDHIDLYYLHRQDPAVPIEESVGAMARMVQQGKVGSLGLSEVSAETLRKAYQTHPIAAVQTEYSLWSRNAEIAVLDACRELAATFVAFSPLARGFLADAGLRPSDFAEKDLRRNMPRFQAQHFSANQKLIEGFVALAEEAGCTIAQLALAWVLAQGPHIVAIPGTTSIARLEENVQSMSLEISPDLLDRACRLINQETISGPRYSAVAQGDISTEEF